MASAGLFVAGLLLALLVFMGLVSAIVYALSKLEEWLK